MGYPVNQSPPSYGISRNEKPSIFMGYPINFIPIVFQIPIANKKQLRPEINLKPELFGLYFISRVLYMAQLSVGAKTMIGHFI